MSQTGDRQDKQAALRSLNVTLAAVTGQVGCLTLLIIFAALFLGRWLDRQFDTSPLITIGLLIASIPITLIVMFWVVRAVTSRFGTTGASETKSPEEGAERDDT